jgi:hypothetical protein
VSPGCFNPRKQPKYLLNRKQGGPHSQSGCSGVQKNLLPLLGFKLQPSSPLNSCYTDYATLAPIFQPCFLNKFFTKLLYKNTVRLILHSTLPFYNHTQVNLNETESHINTPHKLGVQNIEEGDGQCH